MRTEYQELFYQSRPVSKRKPMDVAHRAKQFSPFAALTGLDEAMRETEILSETKAPPASVP